MAGKWKDLERMYSYFQLNHIYTHLFSLNKWGYSSLILHQHRFLQIELLEFPDSRSHQDPRPWTCSEKWITDQCSIELNTIKHDLVYLSRINFPSLYFWLFSYADSWKKIINSIINRKLKIWNQAIELIKFSLHISTRQWIHSTHRICQPQYAFQLSSSSLLSLQRWHSHYEE